MPKVDEWFDAFTATHMGRFPRSDWAKVEPVFWQALQALFIRRGVSEGDALEASARLFDKPPEFISDHPVKLMAAIEAIWRENQAASPSGDTSNREAALAASKDCPHCYGQGLATIYRPAREDCPDIPDERWARIPPQIAAWCVCSMGQWIKANHIRTDPNAEKTMRSLADVFSGRLRWRAERSFSNPERIE